jgi:hypothetical protein
MRNAQHYVCDWGIISITSTAFLLCFDFLCAQHPTQILAFVRGWQSLKDLPGLQVVLYLLDDLVRDGDFDTPVHAISGDEGPGYIHNEKLLPLGYISRRP